ncbi:IS630 family transposase [Actinomadura viridis]|uniref:IS630 family transposase n=1 Tax=Actinomadura viridis TaxID=58110 RepID=UPI0036A1F2A3
MGRPPEVFVRPVSMAEGRRLQRIGRTAKDPVKLRRAIVVLMSAQDQPVPDIDHLLDCSQEYVRGVIHDSNHIGFRALDPKWSGGRPRTISDAARRRICLIARCCPRDLELPFSTWSLSKLAEHLVATGVVASISRESVRRILREGGIGWQATKTWKTSSDPDFMPKMAAVLDLYDNPPPEGRVVCVDEFGPLNLQPRPGRTWRPEGAPARQRATFHRYGGVRHMLAALDLATGKMVYRIRQRKRWREFLAFLKVLRERWPGQKLYLILDNFSPHKHPHVRRWAADNDVELVFLPTYASWLNWIECEFTALRYFALNGTDHQSHTEQGTAIADYMRWRNARALPKRHFAPDSVIRTWTDYKVNVA